jgi:hypothetical protein
MFIEQCFIALILMYINFFLINVVYAMGLKEIYNSIDERFPRTIPIFIIKLLMFIFYAIIYLIIVLCYLMHYKSYF